MENENKIAKLSMLKKYFENLLKQKNIKNIDFIMIFLIDPAVKRKGYATTEELYKMIDRYVYLENMPYNRQVELLESFNTYKGKDLDKPFVMDNKTYDLKKYFNQVVDDIQKYNPNLLTLGYDGIKAGSVDGIVELDKCYTEELEQRVEEKVKKYYDPYKMIYEVFFPYNIENLKYNQKKIANTLLDTYNTKKKYFEYSDYGVIDEKTFIMILDYCRKLDKTELITNILKKNPKASKKLIMQKTGAGESLVKKVSAEYRKNLKKVQ